MPQYRRVCVGGTFDLPLHAGHEKILEKAFETGGFVVIGLTTNAMARTKPYGTLTHAFEDRKQNLENYLKKVGNGNWRIQPLYDEYGTTLTDAELDAIVVSDDTIRTALDINKKRTLCGLAPLAIIKVDTVYGRDGRKLSSADARKKIYESANPATPR